MAAKVPSTTVKNASLRSAASPAAKQDTIGAGPTAEPTLRLGMICVEPARCPPVRRHRFGQPKHSQESAMPNRPQPTSPFNPKPAPPPSHQDPVQPPQQRDIPPCHYYNSRHHLRNCVDLRTDLEDAVVSINNHDRLVLGPGGQEIPMVPAARGDRTMRDHAHAGCSVHSTPPPPPPPSPSQARSNSPPLPKSSSLTSPPSPPARPVSPAPSPARPTRPSGLLLSTEQLTQQMPEVMEHFEQSRKVEVDVQPSLRYTARPPLAVLPVGMPEPSRSARLVLGSA